MQIYIGILNILYIRNICICYCDNAYIENNQKQMPRNAVLLFS